jgi:hypothetical protein
LRIPILDIRDPVTNITNFVRESKTQSACDFF